MAKYARKAEQTPQLIHGLISSLQVVTLNCQSQGSVPRGVFHFWNVLLVLMSIFQSVLMLNTWVV